MEPTIEDGKQKLADGAVDNSESFSMSGIGEPRGTHPATGTGSCLVALSNLHEEDERFTRAPSVSQGFVYRTFSPMSEGGIRPSIFTLVSTAVGGGVLTIPYMFQLCGFAGGIFLLMLGAFCANETMFILMVAAQKAKCNTYAELMAKCFGKNSAVLLDLVIGIYGVGAIISYLIFLGDFIPACASFLGFDCPRAFAIWTSVALGTPLAMPPSLKVFRFVSPFATLALGLTAFVAIYKAARDGVVSEHGVQATHSIVKINLDIFKCFGIATFSYMCHMNVVPVGVEMNVPSDRRIWKVTTRVAVVEMGFYLFIGLAGYFSFGSYTAQNFVTNYATTDPLAFVVRISLATAIFFGVPINMSPTAKSAANVIRFIVLSKENRALLLSGELGAPSHWLRCSCVLVLTSVAGLVAWKFNNVSDVVGLLGGTLGTFLLAVVPLAVYTRVLSRGRTSSQIVGPPSPLIGGDPSIRETALSRSSCMPNIIVSVLAIISVINIAGSGVTISQMIK